MGHSHHNLIIEIDLKTNCHLLTAFEKENDELLIRFPFLDQFYVKKSVESKNEWEQVDFYFLSWSSEEESCFKMTIFDTMID